MGKGGKPDGGDGFEEASRDGCEQENMAAWLLGVNTLKIQPFKLPNLGTNLFFFWITVFFFFNTQLLSLFRSNYYLCCDPFCLIDFLCSLFPWDFFRTL